MGTLICDNTEGVRFECLKLDTCIGSTYEDARKLQDGIHLLEGKLTRTKTFHLQKKSEELSKVTQTAM